MTRNQIVASFAVLLGLLFLVYLPALPADQFGTDDNALINIPQLREFDSISDLAVFFIPGEHIDYYPVRDISYLVDQLLWPESTLGARSHQLFLFWFAGVFLFLILCELRVSQIMSLVVTSLWLLHPYHAESVMWLSGRKDVLAILWTLAAFYFGLRSLKNNSIKFIFLALICFILGGFSKASFLLLPAALLVGTMLTKVQLPKRFVLALVVASVAGLVIAGIQSWFYSNVIDMRMFLPIHERLPSSWTGLGKMVSGIFIPTINVVDTDNYGEWKDLNSGYLIAGLIFLFLFITSLAIATWKRNRFLIFSLLALGALYVPISGLGFPHRYSYSTRYFEPALIALFVIFAYLISRAAIANRRVGWSIAAALITFCLFATSSEATTWSEGILVRKKALSNTPDSVSLKTYLLSELLNLDRNNRLDESDKALKREIISDLEAKCGLPAPSLNCGNFLRYKTLLAEWRGDIASARESLAAMEKSQESLKPRPLVLDRMHFELKLLEGSADASASTDWIGKFQFTPNTQYRLLKLAALCLSNDQSVQLEKRKWIESNLLSQREIDVFLSDSIGENLKEKIKSCVNGSGAES